ncbi:MAG: glutamate-1-semialdehyde-2,1-aminomutase [Chloroflexi bacterium]|nr:glutamate-1-semialdehyde-2,1-aminomutase [Chloroflexota bacterium]
MPSRSERLFQEAQRYLPGGVDSPVRAFRAVGGAPRFIARGRGAYLFDADGKRYVDYVGSWGPLILGHAHPKVVAALQKAARLGTSYGAPTELETTLAKLVVKAFPSIEMLRFVSSGTEACMSAIRAARAYTGRDTIVKFDGCYHGHSDGLLVKAGSGGATFGVPDSAGVPAAYAALTLVAKYNDASSVEALLQANKGKVAAIIIEPIAANIGVVPPKPGFLKALREMADAHGVLLIFDEVISGFRVAFGGAQQLYGIKADLTCLGKIIGGGMPVGAYGGRREIMEKIAPLGPAYQAGTLSGNPLAMTAGIETLKALSAAGVYKRLEKASNALEVGLGEAARKNGREVAITRMGSLLTLFFAKGPADSWAAVEKADRQQFGAFFHRMLESCIYLPPSQFEAWFVSLAHSESDIQKTVRAAEKALAA